MINLLPLSEKRRLWKEYWLRFGATVFSIVLLLEAFALVLFIPTYYAIATSTSDLEKAILERRALAPDGDSGVERDLATIKDESALLSPATSVIDVPPSTLLEEIIREKPRGVRLSSFNYSRGVDNVLLQFSGNALTSDDLLVFRKNVQANKRVVDFRYGNSFVTQKTDIDFTVTITLR